VGFGLQAGKRKHPRQGGGADENSSCDHDVDFPSKALTIEYEGKCRFDTRLRLIT
jgi:hypothetical protein